MSIAVPPRGPGEAELRGQDPQGWLAALSAWAGQVSRPPGPGHYLVSWLESCASLTRLCTSMSVLSLVPERSFSAPICSRTTDRCSAVHFRTKGFRWLKGKSRARAQPRNGVWVAVGGHPQTGTRGPTVVPPRFMPQWAPNFVPPGLRGIFKEDQSLPDNGTEAT